MQHRCCEEYPYIDFSKVSVPLYNINWWEPDFFCTALLTILWPVLRHVCSRLDGWHTEWKRYKAFMIPLLVGGGYVYLLVRYTETMKYQPRWLLLRSNGLLYTGYTACISGIVMVLMNVLSQKDTFEKLQEFLWSWKVFLALILCHTGLALVFASQAGLFLTFVLVLTQAAITVLQEEHDTPTNHEKVE
ncbi:unnamed protein product [Owenia fusiformis]|uniref:Uncharacterized protein n=1 Tax=Owenia fusiformis TaxID=6347 RepID=A0A8J1XS74_OWEFU|nr:unnamed protein product [Owenia fusiformis]